jgi:hypothetical protein
MKEEGACEITEGGRKGRWLTQHLSHTSKAGETTPHSPALRGAVFLPAGIKDNVQGKSCGLQHEFSQSDGPGSHQPLRGEKGE